MRSKCGGNCAAGLASRKVASYIVRMPAVIDDAILDWSEQRRQLLPKGDNVSSVRYVGPPPHSWPLAPAVDGFWRKGIEDYIRNTKRRAERDERIDLPFWVRSEPLVGDNRP